MQTKFHWQGITGLASKNYVCYMCSQDVCPASGFSGQKVHTDGITYNIYIYVCHKCGFPTYFTESNTQIPSPLYGSLVEHIDSGDVEHMYQEARQCYSAGAYNACIMCCRKLLMHIAVSKGAEENQNFKYYVDFLAKEYTPPEGKEWVNHIREKGNEANHEITLMSKEDAEELLSFLEMLLKFIFEWSGRMKRKYQAVAS